MENKKIFSNLVWRFAERVGAQMVAFVVSIILARILAPEDYGTIALVTVFTTVINVFVDSGLGSALIQKKDADDLDFSTVFYTNVVMCLTLYTALFFMSPLIAAFYKRPDLISVIRVLSLTLIISGLKNVQHAYVSKNMIFKKFFFSTLIGTLGAAGLGIAMALMGFGVWALVAQQLFNVTVDTCVLWITVKWRPKRCFSFHRLRGLLRFGWKLLASALLDTVYSELRHLIIGKKYSSADLAFYNKGDQLPKLIIQNINTSIDSVLLPSMASRQDDIEAVKNMTRRAMTTAIFILAPLMMGLAATADNVVLLLLTEKWMPCVPFLRVFCVTYMFWPLHTANLNAIKAMGRSDLFLRLEIIKKIVGTILILVTMRISVWAMCLSLLVSCLASQIINSWPNKKLLNYGYIRQVKDIFPSIGLSVFMAVCVYVFGYVKLPVIALLPLQIIIGAVIYVVGAKLLKLDSYIYVMSMIKPKFRKLAKRG